MRFSQRQSRDHAVLEMYEDECGLRDTADPAGAQADMLEGAPALSEECEPALPEAAQGSKESVVGAGVDIEFPPCGVPKVRYQR